MTVSATSSPTATTTSSSTSSRTNLSSADFLTLLVSELRNQDPMNATSVTDFINQMTSYANFTGQQSINSSLNSLAGSFSSLVTLNSVNYIGHTVEIKGTPATRPPVRTNSADPTPDTEKPLPVLKVKSVRMVSSNCG